MKKILLSVTITCKVLFAQGFHGFSEISFRSYDLAPIIVNMDHIAYGNMDHEIIFHEVTPGYHFIEILKPAGYHPYHGANMQRVFHGRIYVPESVSMNTLLDHHNRLVVTRQLVLAPQISTPYNVQGYGGQGYPVTVMPAYNYMPPYMVVDMFQSLKHSISSQSFESKKLIIAKQAIRANKVTSQQVLELMQLFTFESYKLELAKFAYDHTYDRQNYFLVNNGFTFSSSVSSLASYIGRSGTNWN